MKAKLDHRNKLVKATPKPKKVIKPMATNKAQGDLF